MNIFRVFMVRDVNQYECHGYHDTLPKGKASGILRVNSHGFEFEVGDERGRIPFDGAQIKMGGASDRLVFIAHPQLSGWNFYTSDRSILKNPHLQAHPQLGAVVGKARNVRHANWFLLAAVIVVILAIPTFFIIRSDILTGYLAKKVPANWELNVGKTAIAQYRIGHDFLPQEQANKLLMPLVTPLLEQLKDSRYRYHFEVVNDPTPNAFALPGGFVVIHSGLILNANNAEEVLGVLAHEITHIEEQHGVQNVIGSAGLYLGATAVLGDASGLLAVVANAAPLLLTQSYSRRFEEESDTKGFALLQRAGINPRGLATFFERLMAEEKKQLAKIENEQARDAIKVGAKFLSTHPETEKRIAYLRKLEKQDQKQNYRDFTQNFNDLKQAVKAYAAANKLQGGAS